MSVVKKIFARVPAYVIWLMLSVALWGWIFGRITDTAAENKIVLFVDAYDVQDTALAVRLEEEKPEGIRMVQVHPFSYVLFQSETLLSADLYIIKESDAADYLDSFLPLTEAAPDGWSLDGTPYGLLAYDAQTGQGAAADLITYTLEGMPEENYYLFFGANSLHTGQVDDAAFRVAERLLSGP